MHIIALLDSQGTACLETALYGADDTPANRAKIEAEAIKSKWSDKPVPGTWTDVSENDAFWPDYNVHVSALAAMTASISIKARSPQEAADLAKECLSEARHANGGGRFGWELIDGGRPALGSEAVDSVWDGDEDEELLTIPAQETDEETEARLLADDAADNQRLIDWIADKIGVPQDEELTREHFAAAWRQKLPVVDGDSNADIYGYARTADEAKTIAGVRFADPVVGIDPYGPITLSDGTVLPAAFVAMTTPAGLARAALAHLTTARDLLKRAGCSARMIDRVRLAISSAKGAVRHADHRTRNLV